MTFKNILIIIMAFVVLTLAVLFYFIYNNKNKGEAVLPEFNPESPLVNEPATDELGIEIVQQPGEVGEIEDVTKKGGQVVAQPDLPVNIFSTTGVIAEVGEDFLIIQGDGNNFADAGSRKLKCLVSENILLFDKDKVRHDGSDALSFLAIGDEILVSSEENIRGKTEFTIKNISILN